MLKYLFVSAALAHPAAGAVAGNCEAIRSQIEVKIRAAGVSSFTLTTVEAGDPSAGRVVGTCDLGARKIVYTQASPPPPTAGAGRSTPKARDEPILTECKDGTVSLGGSCRK